MTEESYKTFRDGMKSKIVTADVNELNSKREKYEMELRGCYQALRTILLYYKLT